MGVVRTDELLENLVNPVLEKIDGWMAGRGLQLAHHRTEAVMLTKRMSPPPPPGRLSIAGQPITLIKHLRYLGVILDTRLSFGKHVETVASKASASDLGSCLTSAVYASGKEDYLVG